MSEREIRSPTTLLSIDKQASTVKILWENIWNEIIRNMKEKLIPTYGMSTLCACLEHKYTLGLDCIIF